jgi:hypothetical protein
MTSIDCPRCKRSIPRSKIHRHWSSIHRTHEEPFPPASLVERNPELPNDPNADPLELRDTIEPVSAGIDLDGLGESNTTVFMDTSPDTPDDEPQAVEDVVFEHAGSISP